MNPPTPAVVSIGEAMVVLYPDDHAPLATAETFGSDVGGAEFNLATTVARLGVPAAWISRLGADPFGERILAAAAAAGVDTSAVERDPARPTGIYVKERTVDDRGFRTRMHYYRRDSAASTISTAQLREPAAAALLHRTSYVHTTGITAALSPTAAAAVASLREAIGPGVTVSVDVNYRPQLWPAGAVEPLQALIGQAELLFAGRDELEAYAGHAEPARIFAEHPRLRTIVVKDEALRASSYTRDGRATHVPCLVVEVVEPVGAGDAFAAGYLAALAEGRDDVSALRLGHALAALALVSHGDRPASVPSAAEREAIVLASDADWATWRVRPGELPWASA